MSVQPSISPGRPRISRGAGRRVAWIDPPNAFQGNDAGFHPEPIRPDWIETADPALAALPVAPLAEPAPAAPKLSRKWMATILASIALHTAIAAWFMMGGFDDEVLVEGGEQVTVVQLGNSDADDVASGAEAITDATQVTLIPVTDAKPVETIEAQDVAVAETVTPVETETVEPVVEEQAKPVEEQVAQPTPTETLPEVEPQALVPTQPDIVPEILATDVPELVEDVETVAPVEEKAEPVEEPKEPEPVVKQPVKQAEKQPDRKLEEQREQARKAAAEKREAERAERRKAAAEAAEKKAEAAAAKKAADARKAAQAKAAPSATGIKDGGSSDRQKGRADGDVNGSKAGDAGKGKARNAGNAAVTNYPGKVRAKVARAAGRIPRSIRAGRDVVVSFTVTSSGGLGGVSVARSSGSPALDAAALSAVRRAAPFPAIPDGAGRSSWQFTIPMGLGR